MAEPPAAKRAKLEQWSVDSNECTSIVFLNPAQEPGVVEAARCHPEFTHQLFGEDEQITGFRGLDLSLSISQRSFAALAELKFDEKRASGADDVMGKMREAFPEGLAASRSEYERELAAVEQPDLASLGDSVLRADLRSGGAVEVKQATLCSAHPSVKALHARMQPLLLFFVDGGSAIDPDDPCWHVLLALRTEGAHTVVAGFCTVYRFYAYPDRARLRVSQVLVTPPHQRCGVGRALLLAAYESARACNAVDVTYEEPTDALQALRESVELAAAAALPWLRERASAAVAALPPDAPAANGAAAGVGAKEAAQNADPGDSHPASGADAVPPRLALAAADVARAQGELRLPKQQVLKAWEALLLAALEAAPPERRQAGRQALECLVRRRLGGSAASTRRGAEGKRIFADGEQNWVMMKVGRMAAFTKSTATAPVAKATCTERPGLR
ncbi:hypothetical protein WJX81_003999 [Elliptochloris bilobata]|uniref:histone acetyltransferase n=1 Tax=Elliptochloris bilobata TaxID=381761 RepID=A0AAW1S0E0_9CHLO